MLTSNVIPINISAAYIRADTWIPSASANWLARSAARVPAGWKREVGIRGLFPMSIATAMVSPRARPRARMAEAIMPEEAVGIKTPKMASQRVAPSA